MKKALSFILVVLMLVMLVCPASLAAKKVQFSDVDLHSMSDEELEEAAAAIRAEKRSRIKTKIVLDHASITLLAGKTQKLTAQIKNLPKEETKTPKFTWSSCDNRIATVSNGTVKGVAEGKTTVICSAILSDGTEITAECKVQINIPVQSVSAEVKSISLRVGERVKVKFIIAPDNASVQKLSLSSSDDTVATITRSGNITGKKPGTAIITAMATDGSEKKATISVKVTAGTEKKTTGSTKTADPEYRFTKIPAAFSCFVNQTGTSAKGWINSNAGVLAAAGILFSIDIGDYDSNFRIGMDDNLDGIMIGANNEGNDEVLDFALLDDTKHKYVIGYYNLKTQELYYAKGKFLAEEEAKLFIGNRCDKNCSLLNPSITEGYNYLNENLFGK